MIVLAALSIAVASSQRLLHPQPVTRMEWGAGALVGGGSSERGRGDHAFAGGCRRLKSISLRADGHHLLSDVWTSIGVVIGLILTKVTGWLILDPLIATFVAIHIAWVGIRLLRETFSGLMDTALPEAEQAIIHQTLATYQDRGIQFHALRTRVAGARNFVAFHVLVPGDWTVQQGHDLCDELEVHINHELPGTDVMTHLEPIEDPASWADKERDRRIHHQSLS